VVTRVRLEDSAGVVEGVVVREEAACVQGPVQQVEEGLRGRDVEQERHGRAPRVPGREVPQGREGVQGRGRQPELQDQEVVPAGARAHIQASRTMSGGERTAF